MLPIQHCKVGVSISCYFSLLVGDVRKLHCGSEKQWHEELHVKIIGNYINYVFIQGNYCTDVHLLKPPWKIMSVEIQPTNSIFQ